jgi:hypothetical protein
MDRAIILPRRTGTAFPMCFERRFEDALEFGSIKTEEGGNVWRSAASLREIALS